MSKDYITIYLSGKAILNKSNECTWRKTVMSAFYKIAKYDDFKVSIVNPTTLFNGVDPITDRQVKSFLFNKIRNCDIVLCNLNDSIDSPETCVEIQYAVDNYIPVIGYGRKNAFSWAVNVDCDVVFDTMEEAVAYIKKFYLASSAPLEVG